MTNTAAQVIPLSERYADANALWPRGLQPLTRTEAERAYRRLRRAFGYPVKAGVRVSVRKVWVSAINADNLRGGWRRLVHDVSHVVHDRRYPYKRDHDPLHAVLEIEMARYVIQRGWHLGTLKPKPRRKPTLAEKREAKYQRTLDAIRRWETKERRARNALRKLRATEKRLAKARSAS